MSDEMAPPPPPPPPPPAGGGFDANAALNEFKGADPLDLAVVGAGALALILSFFSSFYTVGVSFGGYSAGSGGISAWHGFFGWAGVLLLLAAAAVTALKILKIAVPNEEIIVVAAAVGGLLFVLLALLVDPVSTYGVVKIGHGWTYWLTLILAVVSGGVTGMKFAKARGLMT